MVKKCAICESRKVKYKQSQLCECCYQFLYYWKNKSVTQIMKRSSTLDYWQRRTDKLLNLRGNARKIKRA